MLRRATVNHLFSWLDVISYVLAVVLLIPLILRFWNSIVKALE